LARSVSSWRSKTRLEAADDMRLGDGLTGGVDMTFKRPGCSRDLGDELDQPLDIGDKSKEEEIERESERI